MSRTPWWRVLAPVVVGGTFLVLTALERRRPLRRVREAKWRHVSRNIVFAGAAAATVNLLERPIVEPLANVIERRRCGLLYVCRLPPPLHLILAVVLLDYTMYVWHVLAHRVPWLWRFHLVHHVDRDLDASTALRFHAGELALSIPWRAMQIAAIGVPPDALRIWQNLLLLSILFHHSNVELPIARGEVRGSLRRHAAYSRHSPFHRPRGNAFELVQRFDRVGLPSWHAAAGRAAAGHYDWRPRIPDASGRDTREQLCAALRCAAAMARVSGRRRAGGAQTGTNGQ